MAEDKKKKNEEAQIGFKVSDYSPAVRQELANLINIERFLKRVKNIEGDESFSYVDCRQYVATRAAMLKMSEEARLKAMAAKQAAKTVPAETPKKLKAVETPKEPTPPAA